MKESKKDKPEVARWVYYSGMGFQMIAVIGLFIYFGSWLDEKTGNQKPFYTALLGLVGVGISLYQTIRSLTKNKES